MAADREAAVGDWTSVRLTEARQVAALMGHDRDDWPHEGVGVTAHFAALRAAGRRSGAIDYLAHALPRLEMIAWTARVIEDAAHHVELAPAARHALDVSLRWVGQPSEEHRRAAQRAAEAVNRQSPERFLGLAIFYSGGSIATPGLLAVAPPDHAAARYAAIAIGQAAYRSGNPDQLFDRALDLGETVARRGMAALAQ